MVGVLGILKQIAQPFFFARTVGLGPRAWPLFGFRTCPLPDFRLGPRAHHSFGFRIWLWPRTRTHDRFGFRRGLWLGCRFRRWFGRGRLQQIFWDFDTRIIRLRRRTRRDGQTAVIIRQSAFRHAAGGGLVEAPGLTTLLSRVAGATTALRDRSATEASRVRAGTLGRGSRSNSNSGPPGPNCT